MSKTLRDRAATAAAVAIARSLDLSDHLTPWRHVVTVNVEDVRPKDGDGHLGHWRVSSYLIGWEN